MAVATIALRSLIFCGEAKTLMHIVSIQTPKNSTRVLASSGREDFSKEIHKPAFVQYIQRELVSPNHPGLRGAYQEAVINVQSHQNSVLDKKTYHGFQNSAKYLSGHFKTEQQNDVAIICDCTFLVSDLEAHQLVATCVKPNMMKSGL
jgi:uncharacterized protein VirK/YbjX